MLWYLNNKEVMSSQFEKRKAKAEQAIKEKRGKDAELAESKQDTALETPIEPQPEVKAEATLTHEGYDIVLSADGRKHEVIVFKFNPRTREVEIADVLPVQRQVGLMYQNHKKALKTILRRK